MPMDPNLANAILNPPRIKTPDPMEQMGGVLTNALMMEKLSMAQEGRTRNALIDRTLGGAYKNGKLDKDLARQGLAQAGAASAIPDLEESWVKGDKAQAETDKIHTEALIKSLEFTRQYLPAVKTPQDYTQLMFNDSVIGPQLTKQFGGPEKLLAVLNQMSPEQFVKLKEDQMAGVENTLKNHYQLVQEKDQQRLVAAPEYGSGAPRVVGTYGPEPNKGVTVNVGGGDKYAEEMAKLKANHDFNKGTAAEAAPAKISELERAIPLVDRAFTGYWAEGKNTASSATGVNQDAVQATQELKQLLSGDMLKNIGTLRNQFDVKLGSVTEKEFAQLQNTTPRITDSPATIKGWLRRAIDLEKRTMADYERLVTRVSTNPVTAPVASAGMIPQPPNVPGTPAQVFADGDGDPIPVEAIADLMRHKNDPKHHKMFDQAFGKPGLAALILKGGGPTGQAPFPPPPPLPVPR